MRNIYNIIIFGTGNGSKKVKKALKMFNVKVCAYADNNEEKIDCKINKIPVITPQNINNYKYDYIIIASIYYGEISKQLIDIGVNREKILKYFKKYETQEFFEIFGKIINYKTIILYPWYQFYENQLFKPKLLSLIINPFFIIRKGLYKGIKEQAPFMYGNMLDFGCGKKPYKKMFNNVNKYIGLDFNNTGHNHNGEDIDFYYDGSNIPFSSSYFDTIFSSEVFEHIFNIDEILDELNRVIKLNGKMLITLPFVWDEHEMPYDFGRYTSFGIEYLLKKHGFEIINSKKSTNFIETIFQMWNTYLYETFPKNKLLNYILTIILIFPSNLIGSLLGKILPKNYNFYNNNIVLVKKVQSK